MCNILQIIVVYPHLYDTTKMLLDSAYVGVKLSEGRYRLLNCGAGIGLSAGSTAA